MSTPSFTVMDHWRRAEAFGEDFNGSPCMHLPLVPMRNGYVRISIGGNLVLAHRALYEALIGPIPAGMHADHMCNVPSCVNPWHIKPATPRENVLRNSSPHARNSRKTHCPRGHELAGDNLFARTDGRRKCRACGRKSARERMARNRARLKALGLPRPDVVSALRQRAQEASRG